MTKMEAIENLAHCTWLDTACRNIAPQNWQDLRQDFFVKMISLEDAYFVKIRDLRVFSIRVLINMQGTVYRKKAKQPHKVDIDNHPNVAHEDQDHNELLKLAAKDYIIERLPMYERIMWNMHENGMSMNAIHKETTIPRSEVNRTINQIKSLIKELCLKLPS